MEIIYSLTAQDYEKAAKNLFKNRRNSVVQKALIFPAVYLIVSGAIAAMCSLSAAFWIFTGVMTLALFGILLFLAYSKLKKAVKAKILQTGPRALYTKIKVTVDRGEILIETSRGKTSAPLSALKDLGKDREFVYLEFTMGDMLIVPLRSAEGDVEQFYKEIQSGSVHKSE